MYSNQGLAAYVHPKIRREFAAFALFPSRAGMGCCGSAKGLGCACGCGGTCNKGLGSLFDITSWGPADYLTVAGIGLSGWLWWKASKRTRGYRARMGRR